MNPLSTYILTHNSEQYLRQILEKITRVSDEVLIIDSGSTDQTQEIAESFQQAKFVFHEFQNFRDQRAFAESQCEFDIIMFLDSDEMPDAQFLASIQRLKEEGFEEDAYTVSRPWQVLGKEIHCIYPITAPDHPIRLYKRGKVSYAKSQLVHESLSGFEKLGSIEGKLMHITFETKDALKKKLEFYTDLAAQDLIRKKKTVNTAKVIFNPIASFIKWYFLKAGYKDGTVGLVLGKYAYDYTRQKYLKAKALLAQKA